MRCNVRQVVKVDIDAAQVRAHLVDRHVGAQDRKLGQHDIANELTTLVAGKPTPLDDTDRPVVINDNQRARSLRLHPPLGDGDRLIWCDRVDTGSKHVSD
jgi:hypothetical protein